MKSIVRGIIVNLITACMVALGLWWAYTYLYAATPVKESCFQGLGDRPQTDIHYYLNGSELSLGYASIDFSDIDFTSPGIYDLHVYHGFESFDFKYEIADNILPVIECAKDFFVCETGKVYDEDFFIGGVSDLTPVDTKLFNPLNNDAVSVRNDGHSVAFMKSGSYSLGLYARDTAGNSSTRYVDIKVGAAPEIFGTTEFYVAKGSAIDIKASVLAHDAEDGMIGDRVYNDFDDALFNTEGDHEFLYYVQDSDGLTSTHKGMVHVYNPLLLQDKINLGILSPDAKNVAGVINPYDLGYLVEDDIETVVSKIGRAVVCIYYDEGYTRTRGSGYVVKADASGVVLATNHHVVGEKERVNVTFSNGSVYEGVVAARSYERDIAFVKIPISAIGSGIDNIRTVHINAGYYYALNSQPDFELGAYCIYPDASEWLRHYGKILDKSGAIPDPDESYAYTLTEVSLELIKGMSGSAIVDSHGNLICMATCYYEDMGHRQYYCVTLSDILDFYEEAFGERLEYY